MTRTRPTADQVAERRAEAARQHQVELFDSRLTTDAGVHLSLFDPEPEPTPAGLFG